MGFAETGSLLRGVIDALKEWNRKHIIFPLKENLIYLHDS
jgi:hypothetical protein